MNLFPIHALSLATVLASMSVEAVGGNWAWTVLFGAFLFYVNLLCIDVELARHRAFGEPHPTRRITIWFTLHVVLSLAGNVGHQIYTG